MSLRAASARCRRRRAHSTAGSASGATCKSASAASSRAGSRSASRRRWWAPSSSDNRPSRARSRARAAIEMLGGRRLGASVGVIAVMTARVDCSRHARRGPVRWSREDSAGDPRPAMVASCPSVGVSWSSLRWCAWLQVECCRVSPRRPGPKVPAGPSQRAIGDLRPWCSCHRIGQGRPMSRQTVTPTDASPGAPAVTSAPLLAAEGVRKIYRTGAGEVWALAGRGPERACR